MSDWSNFARPHHCYVVDPSRVRTLKRALEQARQYGGFKALDALAESWLPVGEEDADWFQDPDYSWRIHALLERCRVDNEDVGCGDNPLLEFEDEPTNLVPAGPAWHTWTAVNLEDAVQVFAGPARGLKPPTISSAAWTQTVEASLRQKGDDQAAMNANQAVRDWKLEAAKARDGYAGRLQLLGRKKAWVLTWREGNKAEKTRQA